MCFTNRAGKEGGKIIDNLAKFWGDGLKMRGFDVKGVGQKRT